METQRYGFQEIVSFLSDYAGKHYTTPERAGDRAEYMVEMKRRGQDARQKFITFGERIADQISGLEYMSCSNWINQGQNVERYLWIELKRDEWKDYPNSVSLSLEPHNVDDQKEGYYLSVRAECRDGKSEKEDYKRQMRLLDCDLSDGMVYMTRYKNQEYHNLGTDTEKVRTLCENGTIQKVEVVKGIEDLPKKDKAGIIFGEAIKAVKEIMPLYEYIMGKDDWWPALSEYDPGFSAQEYHDLFLDESIVKRSWLEGLYELYLMPGHLGTCKQLGERYGYAPSHYISYLSSITTNIAKRTHCAITMRGEESTRRWPILFVGRRTTDKSQGAFCWKMREPVVAAVEMLIEEGVFSSKENENMVQFDHNLILYGPPGTGKTYNCVNYAVAICEGRPVADVMEEAYPDVLVRYRKLKDEGRIAFTTFHQSYPYILFFFP